MFTEVLPANAKKTLATLGDSHLLDDSYLGGGTAAALQLGHRISYDFDFFTPREFEPSQFAKQLGEIGNFELEGTGRGTVTGRFEGVRWSLFLYQYPVLFPLRALFGIKILDIRDIAAMKIAAVATRGTKRDFMDVYFILKETLSLKEVLALYDGKFGNLAANIVHVKKSLTYFADAEPGEMPRMLKAISWKEVTPVRISHGALYPV